MSFMSDDLYKNMVSKEIVQKSTSTNDNSSKFVMLPRCDEFEETLVVAEEIVVGQDMETNRQVRAETHCENKETSVYFDESMSSNSNVTIEYTESSELIQNKKGVKAGCVPYGIRKETLMLNKGDCESDMGNIEVTTIDQDGDEETIATFVTATGQQLALYAVEDSDEIFAVAVYDENGDPPTNFQFLMKADVERLIGEGAVRTVKKPTQIKKQLLTTQPPIFFSKPEAAQTASLNKEEKRLSYGNEKAVQKHKTWGDNSGLLHEPNIKIEVKDVSNMTYEPANKEESVTYVMMDECSMNIDEPESDHEIIEQSTVQYILLEDDQSESELTFDEIQATLRNLKSTKRKSTPSKSSIDKTSVEQHDVTSTQRIQYNHLSQNSCTTPNNRTMSSAAEKKFTADRQELLDTLSDSPPTTNTDNTKLDLSNGSTSHISSETVPIQLRTKRPRKQQLISVNREDSEIIIQPASLLNEEDNNVKKPGKRRRKVVSHARYRNNESKRIKRVKRKEVEVIEIDVEEDENQRDIVEITLDDSKDKYSSDKENEIIMVGDSEDESQQSDAKATMPQCQHCSRSFRQQRALETHLRVCTKSAANTIKLNDQKLKNTNRANNPIKKEYACKICQEKFDVVVALARHVRSVHSQRKKRRYSKSPVEAQPQSEPEPEEKPELDKENANAKSKKQANEVRNTPLKVMPKVKRKKRNQQTCAWEVKKLSCTDCGRWFPSAAMLRAHYLQHETKKSDQVRRCQVCKKLMKSRLLYMRHLKMHTQQSAKHVSNIQKKLHTTRSVTRKITTLRKRGRPRKL